MWSKIAVAEIKVLFPVVPAGGFWSELSSRIMSEMYAKRIKIVPFLYSEFELKSDKSMSGVIC